MFGVYGLSHLYQCIHHLSVIKWQLHSLLLLLLRLVAARVLERKSAVFKGDTMFMSKPHQSSEADTSQPVVGERQHCMPTIKVSNVEPSLSKEMLTMYFENFKRSHGGEVKDLRLVPEKKKAFVTFKDPTGMFF